MMSNQDQTKTYQQLGLSQPQVLTHSRDRNRPRRRMRRWVHTLKRKAHWAVFLSLIPLMSTILTVSTTLFINMSQVHAEQHQHELTAIQQVIEEQLLVSRQINHAIMDWRTLTQLSQLNCHQGHYAGNMTHYERRRAHVEFNLINIQYLAANVFNPAVESKIGHLLALANSEGQVCVSKHTLKPVNQWVALQTQVNQLMRYAIDKNRHQLQTLL